MSTTADTDEANSTHDHDFTGTFVSPDGTSGAVERDDGTRFWLPNSVLSDTYFRYGSRIAFDTEGNDSDYEGSVTGPRVGDATVLSETYDYEHTGTIVYIWQHRLYVDVPGREEDAQLFMSRVYNPKAVEVGRTIEFDGEGANMRDAEVRPE
ncbi:hypothetical protein [Halosegnis longus]|uniref:hypothetical protein n=1 Tax=Halosegnis longus TaxID=2216012 RepID=UPI00129D402A|nr:hypothetical protein [Halosegnis longus]